MSFDRQPLLDGERFSLRPIRADDRAALAAAASDPLIWEQHPYPRAGADAFDSYFAQRLADPGALLITDPRTGEVIGTTSYCDVDEAAYEVEIGYTFLVRSRWGDGTNTELKRRMLDHAFAHFEHVIFMVAMENHRSQAAVRKLGAVEIEPRMASTGDLYATFRISRAQHA